LSLFNELKRRNVIRVVIAYAVVAWLLLQVGATLAPALLLPTWSTSLLAFFLILGFPLALFFAWAYEITPEGLKRESTDDEDKTVRAVSGRKFDFVIIGLLTLTVSYFVYDKYDSATAVDVKPVRRSIAVLPFINMSADPDQEYFTDGLSEELLHLLAQVKELRVTSRSSAFSFKGKDFKIADVGKELGVEHVLEGSVRKSGNRIRITAQLIKVEDDSHIWSDSYDLIFDDIFAIQDEIAQAVVDELEITLLSDLPHASTTVPEVYTLYLKAGELAKQQTLANLEQAEEMLHRALEIDPGYAPAWARLGRVNTAFGEWGFRQIDECFELAREQARRAIELDPDAVDVYSLLGTIAMKYDRDWSSAQRYFDKSLSLDANNSETLIMAARLARLKGNTDLGLQHLNEAIALDPFSVAVRFELAVTLMFSARRYDDAADVFRKILKLNPDTIAANYGLGQALFLAGDYAAALGAFENEADEIFSLDGQAQVHHALGNSSKSDSALAELIRLGAENAGAQIAEVYAVRGETDAAVEWLQRAYDNHDTGVNGVGRNPYYDNMRDDPGFKAFLERTGLGM
jgi:TolB-like protein/cytochrome c-type biogenesis protein CcmH/NrfG